MGTSKKIKKKMNKKKKITFGFILRTIILGAICGCIIAIIQGLNHGRMEEVAFWKQLVIAIEIGIVIAPIVGIWIRHKSKKEACGDKEESI